MGPLMHSPWVCSKRHPWSGHINTEPSLETVPPAWGHTLDSSR